MKKYSYENCIIEFGDCSVRKLFKVTRLCINKQLQTIDFFAENGAVAGVGFDTTNTGFATFAEWAADVEAKFNACAIL